MSTKTLTIEEQVYYNLHFYQEGYGEFDPDEECYHIYDKDLMATAMNYLLTLYLDNDALMDGYFIHPANKFEGFVYDIFEWWNEEKENCIFWQEKIVSFVTCEKMSVYLPSSKATDKEKLNGYDLVRVKLEYQPGSTFFYTVFDAHM